MNLLPFLVCLLHGLIQFTDAQCQFSPTKMFCKDVDSKGFLHEFYDRIREEYIAESNVIEISGGNWTIIDYFPTLSISGKEYTITSLAINEASIKQIDENAFIDLGSLISLDLSHNQLNTTLFLNYLPTLKKLNLASNKFTHVPSFPYFLSHLDMSNNKIRCLDFRNVSNIRVADFSGNKIDSLLHSLLHIEIETKFFASLNLSRNKITEFIESQYGPKYYSLDLSFNNLSVVDLNYEKIFLNLSNCNINKIGGLTLVNWVHMYCFELDFSQCQFEIINSIRIDGKLKIQVARNSQLTNVTNDIRNLVKFNQNIKVDLSYSSITNIPAKAFSDFHLQSLILSHMNVSELNGFTFESSNFDVLDLSNSHIKILQPNVFSGLRSRFINLSFNEISDIKNAFNEAVVTKIDLSFNALRFIENHSFRNSCDLSVIILSNCSIEKIEPLAFVGLKSLANLDLSHNRLSILERNAFHDLPLMELNLRGNKITTIRSRAFSNLRVLGSLNLSSIHLHNLETNAFANLLQIDSIDLSHNYINIIQPQLFVDTPRLETVDFSYNNISKINRFSYNSTDFNIRYLALGNSRIGFLEADCFQGMYNLEELHFKNSDIRFLESGALNSLYNVYHLDSQNLFRHIEHIEKDTFRDLKSLKMLNLSGLSVKTIESNSFRGLSNIQELLLSKNDLGRLNEDTFAGLNTLKVLDLSINHIDVIDENIFNPLKNLEELHLQHNYISRIEPSYFKRLNSLKILRLDHNQIGDLERDSFFGLQNLQELHLNNNNLHRWEVGVFQHLTNLSVLNLSRNNLESIETGAFPRLVSLRVLDLTEVSLNNLDEVGVFFSIKKLEHLYLDGNNLRSFAYKRLLLNLKNLVYIGISYNEWQCTFLSFMMEHLNNKNIYYEPKIPVYDNKHIDGVGCSDYY